MKEVTATVVRFQADDGSVHESEAACKAYEDELKRVTYWVIRHSPDLTEGRGTTRLTCVKVITPYGDNDAQMWMDDYCFRVHGRPIAFAQGASACPSWTLTKADKARFDRHTTEAEHDRYGTVTVALLKIQQLDKDGYGLKVVTK